MRSSRYENFKAHGLQCIECGRIGTHFYLERHASDNSTNKFHFNLYTDDDIMMTKDHIVPRAKGGTDVLTNYQVMCTKCNSKKGHDWLSEEQLIHKAVLKEAQEHLSVLKERVNELLANCPHDIIKDDLTDGAYCSICNKRLGWYCKDSPDKHCHYFTEMDQNGAFYVPGLLVSTTNHLHGYSLEKQKAESTDECIYCHEPEERA